MTKNILSIEKSIISISFETTWKMSAAAMFFFSLFSMCIHVKAINFANSNALFANDNKIGARTACYLSQTYYFLRASSNY